MVTTARMVTTRFDASDTCPAGGTRIDSGVDDNGDGALSDAEVDTTAEPCDGALGADAPPGESGCASMGLPLPGAAAALALALRRRRRSVAP